MRYLPHLLILSVIAFFLVACQSTPTPTLPPTITPVIPTTTPTTIPPTPLPTATLPSSPRRQASTAAEQSYLRWAHAIADLPPVDIWIDPFLMASELGYGQSTEPTELAAGDYIARVVTTAENRTIIEQPFTVSPGTTLLLLLGGLPEAPILTTYIEDHSPLHPGESRVTLIHAIPRGPALILQGNSVDLTDAVTFSQSTAAITVPVVPMTFTLRDGNQIAASYAMDLSENYNYTLIVTGKVDNPSTYALMELANQVPGFAQLRAINAAEEAVSLDFYVNGVLLAANVESTRAGEWQYMPAGFCNATIYLAGTDSTVGMPLTSLEFTAGRSEVFSLIGMGTSNDLRITALIEDLAPVAPEQVRITFVNTLNTTRPVRGMEGENEIPDLSDLSAQQVSNAILLDARIHNFSWQIVDRDGRLGSTVERAMNVDFPAGRSYLYLMMGRDGGAPPIIFSEVVGIDETLAFVDTTELPTPQPPTYIRLVNALYDHAPIDYFVDGIAIAISLEYGQITLPIVTPSGVHAISVRAPGDTVDATILDYDFIIDHDYTFYVYGADAQRAEILAMVNPPIGTNNPVAYVRLVNVTPETATFFDLGYAASGQSVSIPPTNPNAEDSGAVPFREPLFTNITKPIMNVGRGEASVLIPLSPGLVDFYVIDAALDMVAAKTLQYSLVAGIQYDMIVYQELHSAQVHILLIPYIQP